MATKDTLTVKDLQTLNEFREKLNRKSCRKCPMHETLTDGFYTPVVSRGNGRIMFVGAAVTPDEHKSNEPFTGSGGMQADNLIQKELMLDPKNDLYFTNLMKCRGNMDINIKNQWKRQCARYLLKEIHLVDPHIIVFLGPDQAKIMLGKQPAKTGSLAQYFVGGKKRWVYVMHNIAGLIRSSSYHTEVRRQLRVLRDWIKEHTDVYQTRGINFETIQNNNGRKYVLVDNEEKIQAMLDDLRDAKSIALDTETNSLNVWWEGFRTVGYSLAKDDITGYYIPVGHKQDPKDIMGHVPVNLPHERAKAALRELFGAGDKHVAFANVGYDYRVLKKEGLAQDIFHRDKQGKPMWHDVLLLWYLIDENISDSDSDNRMRRGLKEGARTFLNSHRQTFQEVMGNDKVTFEYVSPEDALEYAADDAIDTIALAKHLYPKVKYESNKFTDGHMLGDIYPDELIAALVFSDAHMRGMGLNMAYRRKLRKTLLRDYRELLEEIAAISGPVGVNAPSDLKRVMESVITDDTVWEDFASEYEPFHFDKTTVNNFQRFYKKRWKESEKQHRVKPGRWEPQKLDKWLGMVQKARKINKYRTTYVDGIANSIEKIVHSVSVGRNSDGQIVAIYTEGWKVNAKGEVLRDFKAEPMKQKGSGLLAETLLIDEYLIHGEFRTIGPSSGRLSSNNPNLQNLPRDAGVCPDECPKCKTEWEEWKTVRPDITRSRWHCQACGHTLKTYVYDIRRMYTPRMGYEFASADWDAMEVSLMASVSGCTDLCRLVHIRDTDPSNPEGDLHTVTGAKINGLASPHELKKLMKSDSETERSKGKGMRSMAKPVNFGIMYGIGAPGLAQQLKDAGIPTTEEQAQSYIDAWYELFPGVKRHVDDSTRELRANKRLVNIYGRIRHVPFTDDVLSALNFLIQGAGANIAKRASNSIWEHYLDNPDVNLVNIIHDELVIEYKPGYEYEVAQLMYDVMNIPIPGRKPVNLTAEPEIRIDSLSKAAKSVEVGDKITRKAA